MNLICQKRLKEILNYDPNTGIFTWLEKIADKVVIGKQAGYERPNGYRCIRINKRSYREHQLAFMYMLGYFPQQVDHLDHNPSNNKWSNLVAATYASNGKNHPITKRNTTGVVGVSQRKDGKYVARIYVNKKHVFLGVFDTLSDAKIAREHANLQHGFHINHGK